MGGIPTQLKSWGQYANAMQGWEALLCGGHSSSDGLITWAPSTTSWLVSWTQDFHLFHLSGKPPQTSLLKCSFHPWLILLLQPSPPSASFPVSSNPTQSFKTQGSPPPGRPVLIDIILNWYPFSIVPSTPTISTTLLDSQLDPIIYCFLMVDSLRAGPILIQFFNRSHILFIHAINIYWVPDMCQALRLLAK